MEILTIALRQNKTILGKFKKKKNTFKIEDIVSDKSLLPLISTPKTELLDAQVKYLVDALDAADAEVYVTVPSTLCRQDCWQSDAKVVDRVKLTSWVETLLTNEIRENYAVGLPMVQRYDKKIYVSGAGIKRTYIDRIYHAFQAAGADLVAIEAESAAYVRAIARWETNYLLVDIDETATNITAYCSKVGMYTATMPIGASSIQISGALMDDLITEIELAAATWNFPAEAPKQIFVTGQCGEEVIRRLRVKRDNVYTIALPKLANVEAFRRDLLVLPIGTVYRNFYEKGIQSDANSNYEFSAGVGRDRKSVPAYQAKIRQYLNLARLRGLIRRNR